MYFRPVHISSRVPLVSEVQPTLVPFERLILLSERAMKSALQTSDNAVGPLLGSIVDAQAKVDACSRLVSAECKSTFFLQLAIMAD